MVESKRKKYIRVLNIAANHADDGMITVSVDEVREIIDLLTKQEVRVMTREEASETLMHGDFVIVEDRVLDMIWLGMRGDDNMELASGEYFDFDDLEKQDYRNKYGKSFRFWTSRPTPEQMRDTKWEEENDAE